MRPREDFEPEPLFVLGLSLTLGVRVGAGVHVGVHWHDNVCPFGVVVDAAGIAAALVGHDNGEPCTRFLLVLQRPNACLRNDNCGLAGLRSPDSVWQAPLR